MEMPAILKGDSLTRLLQGAAAGAIITLIVGFNWGGWVTGGTAKEMVQRSTTSADVRRTRSSAACPLATAPTTSNLSSAESVALSPSRTIS